MTPEERLAGMNLELPTVPTPVGAYVPALRVGSMVWTSGQLPTRDGKLVCTGAVGAADTAGVVKVNLEAARECARVATLNALGALAGVLGGLSKVKRVVQMTGFVNSAPGFIEQHLVLNGASELLVEVFGDAGRHTRAAVGVAGLPLNAPVELTLLIEAAD